MYQDPTIRGCMFPSAGAAITCACTVCCMSCASLATCSSSLLAAQQSIKFGMCATRRTCATRAVHMQVPLAFGCWPAGGLWFARL
jgi:hypothetical protein